MNAKLIPTTALFMMFLIGCETVETPKNIDINSSSISFTDCITLKSTDSGSPSVQLTATQDGQLTIKMKNTEFCCATDSVSIDKTINDSNIGLLVIDNGPLTDCYCPHDLEFTLTSLEEKTYELRLIESENAYSRDTFELIFTYSEMLDTTITVEDCEFSIMNYPLDYVETELGGCNGEFTKSVNYDLVEENDTLIIYENEETLKIFAGLNLICCIDFGTESEIVNDTLVMRLITLNDEFCDCMCYYTFDFIYDDYIEQGFNYVFYIDEEKRFEGKYNL